jgi:cytochrome c553
MVPCARWLARTLLAAAFAATPVHAQNLSNGESIYRSICISCHGMPPVGGPENAGNNPALISSALANVPAMRFLQGAYTASDLVDIAAFIASVLAAPPPPPTGTPTQNYTDLWWNENESGWGLNIIQHAGSNNIFGVMYTYEPPNRPLWLVMPGGSWSSATTFTGPLYRVSGPPFNQTFDPTKTVVTQVGNCTIAFTSSSAATLTFVVNGVSTTKSITRQPF